MLSVCDELISAAACKAAIVYNTSAVLDIGEEPVPRALLKDEYSTSSKLRAECQNIVHKLSNNKECANNMTVVACQYIDSVACYHL